MEKLLSLALFLICVAAPAFAQTYVPKSATSDERKSTVYTLAGLPACVVGTVGRQYEISDDDRIPRSCVETSTGVYGYVRTSTFNNAGALRFTSAAALDAAVDAGVARNAAGVVEINNGTIGTLRDLAARKVTLTTTDASGFTAGANGATNPVLKVDASTASVATGVTVKGAAAGSGATLSAISSGTNENLILTGKGTGGVAIGSSGTAISTVLHGNVTVDLPSIAANTETIFSITITGAATGNKVTLNPPSTGLTAGLSLRQVYVNATNTVYFVVANQTGSAIDEASGTWNYLIIQ